MNLWDSLWPRYQCILEATCLGNFVEEGLSPKFCFSFWNIYGETLKKKLRHFLLSVRIFSAQENCKRTKGHRENTFEPIRPACHIIVGIVVRKVIEVELPVDSTLRAVYLKTNKSARKSDLVQSFSSAV